MEYDKVLKPYMRKITKQGWSQAWRDNLAAEVSESEEGQDEPQRKKAKVIKGTSSVHPPGKPIAVPGYKGAAKTVLVPADIDETQFAEALQAKRLALNILGFSIV